MGENKEKANKLCNVDECPNSEETKNIGFCMICQFSFHYSCVGVKPKTVFVCKGCRSAVTNIKRLGEIAETLKESQTAKYDDLKEAFDRKSAECEAMRKQLNDLKNEVDEIKRQRLSNVTNAPSVNAPPSSVKLTTPHLLMADSLLRDVDPQYLRDTTFVSLCGAKISTLRERLNKYKGSTYETVTYHVGTNNVHDIKDDAEKLNDIIDEYKQLIHETKALTKNVIVSSVCPRLDTAKDLVAPFNTAMRDLCQEEDVRFVDHSPSFMLGDGSVNDGYIWKNGPHLTRPGVNCLVQNLKINVRQGVTDVTRQTREYRHFPSSAKTNNIHVNHDGCRHCNERGHNMDTCRHSRPVICNTCKMRGHKSKHHRA